MLFRSLVLNPASDLMLNTTETEQATIFNVFVDDIGTTDKDIHCIVYEIDLTFDNQTYNNKILSAQYHHGSSFLNLVVKNQTTTIVRFFSESEREISITIHNKNILPSKNF